MLATVLTIPSQEFFQHPSYSSVEYASSFEYWQIKKEADLILVAPPAWFNHLQPTQQKQLLQLQVIYNRGLIIPLPYFHQHPLPDEAIVAHQVVLTASLWEQLPQDLKEQVLTQYAQDWDSWSASSVTELVPTHLRTFANTFPAKSGANCLAAVLFALSKEEWLVHEWVHTDTFKSYLHNNQFCIHNGNVKSGDVLVYLDDQDNIQHATYCITENLFFNKNGQTLFHPWKLVTKSDLTNNWGKMNRTLYRKQM